MKVLAIAGSTRAKGTSGVYTLVERVCRASGLDYELVHLKGKTIKGCIYGDANPPVDFPRLLNLYKSGKLNLDDMVSRTYTIDEAPQAFEDMKNNANARGVIVF